MRCCSGFPHQNIRLTPVSSHPGLQRAEGHVGARRRDDLAVEDTLAGECRPEGIDQIREAIGQRPVIPADDADPTALDLDPAPVPVDLGFVYPVCSHGEGVDQPGQHGAVHRGRDEHCDALERSDGERHVRAGGAGRPEGTPPWLLDLRGGQPRAASTSGLSGGSPTLLNSATRTAEGTRLTLTRAGSPGVPGGRRSMNWTMMRSAVTTRSPPKQL
jgi:hypothetical protein